MLYPIALPLALFSALYNRVYLAVGFVAVAYMLHGLNYTVYAALAGMAGLFLCKWETEREQRLAKRDESVQRVYELEALQNELLSASQQIERMTAVSERARIAREIHDNAGHEIVAAYISLQTARELLSGEGMELFDAALERLDTGVYNIRQAVHNLAPLQAIGVAQLKEICEKHPAATMHIYGQTDRVPLFLWEVLSTCLKECLTNAVKHCPGEAVRITLDVAPNLVRLCVENNVYMKSEALPGVGLRNLRHRAGAVGGVLSVTAGDIFRVVCVLPIKG
jgi:signal transduction histidine kinase